MKKIISVIFITFNLLYSQADSAALRNVLLLNGIAGFEQTEDAFPPKEFTRKIQVPGLIDLAEPKIEQYEKYFHGLQKPKYSWYKFIFRIDSTFVNRYANLKILKSRFNTQIFLNGFDCGTFMQCNTPIETDLTEFLKFNEENILLVRVGERKWLPKESALGFDREKFTDIPGIWDDIFIRFTGPIELNRILVLPEAKKKTVKLKIKLENRADFTERNMELAKIEYAVSAFLREKKTKKIIGNAVTVTGKVKCQQSETVVVDFRLKNIKTWQPQNPFLYEAVVKVEAKQLYFDNYGNPDIGKQNTAYGWKGKSDEKVITFGIRDFKAEGKRFLLNGKEIKLFGSSFTLNRFFEDKKRGALPWNRKWVEKLMVQIPKAMGWNMFRVSIGLLPSFWYDLADEYGFLIQNEYPMWNLRGRNDEVKKEYTDWVWSDGNHPSIVIWDALNEQTNSYVGKELLPALRKLDPTRIWDAGWNTTDNMTKIEMKEIHWYTLAHGWWLPEERVINQRKKYRFGNLFSNVYGLKKYVNEKVPLILNEYAWLWLNRDGEKSAIRTYGSFTGKDVTPFNSNYEYYEEDGTQLYKNRDIYEYYLGGTATAKQRRDFQAYLLAIETEVARASRMFAGIISFPYLTNNNGYTGDWFAENIEELKPTPGLLVQYHAMKPFAAFIDLEDGRYLKNPKRYKAGEKISFGLLLVNDTENEKSGVLSVRIRNQKNIVRKKIINVKMKSYSQLKIPVELKLPVKDGGYMIITELNDTEDNNINQVSRRYIGIGKGKAEFPEYEYELPNGFPGEE